MAMPRKYSFRHNDPVAAPRCSVTTAMAPDPSLGDRAETSRARRSCSQNRTRPTSLSYVLRSSADWRRILQPALAPEFVEAASEPERRLLADVAFEALAVIADLLDDVVGPVLREPSHLTHLVFDA